MSFAAVAPIRNLKERSLIDAMHRFEHSDKNPKSLLGAPIRTAPTVTDYSSE